MLPQIVNSGLFLHSTNYGGMKSMETTVISSLSFSEVNIPFHCLLRCKRGIFFTNKAWFPFPGNDVKWSIPVFDLNYHLIYGKLLSRMLGTVQKNITVLLGVACCNTHPQPHTQVRGYVFTFASRKWIRIQYQTVQIQRDFLLGTDIKLSSW